MMMIMIMILLLLVPASIVAAISEPATEACVELRVWENPGDDDAVVPSCDGEPTKTVLLPVGTRQYQNCAPGDDNFSSDWYCSFPEKLMHQNGYFGTQDCQKQHATYALETTIKSGKCLDFTGFVAMMYTCKAGPCPSSTATRIRGQGGNDEVEVILERIAKMALDTTHPHTFASAMTME